MAGATEIADLVSGSPEIVDLPRRTAVARRAVLHPSGIAQECEASFTLLEAHLKKSGAEANDHPYCIYYFFTPLLTRMEVGIPFKLSSSDTTVPEDPAGGIIVVTHPEVKAAATWHIGPYQKLGDTYKALCAWIRRQGKSPGSLMFEEYYNNPRDEKDPEKLKTRVYITLSDGFLGSIGSCTVM